MKERKEFKVMETPLTGINLIEASAGTGKTYSVAILTLRLLLEKEIPINEILMVTFTEAAVAELEERIRHFIRLADHHNQGEKIENLQIQEIVNRSLKSKGKEEVERLLHSALINLDETAIKTIHGFCQQTLNEYAFETNQLFHAELISDINELLTELSQKFWRENITVLPKELLHYLTKEGLTIGALKGIVQSFLEGKSLRYYTPNEKYNFPKNTNQYLKEIQNKKEEVGEKQDAFIDYFNSNKSLIEEEVEKMGNRGKIKKQAQSNLSSANQFMEFLFKNKDKDTVTKALNENLLEKINAITQQKEIVKEATDEVLNTLYAYSIQEITQLLEERKSSMNLMTFDDIIQRTHFALCNDFPEQAKQVLQRNLIEELQKRYKAVFIDEFQDTDRMQYAIFQTAFAKLPLTKTEAKTEEEDRIIFYIGDPKQSIYSWRQADISTYFKARENVDSFYTMTTNFRSSKRLVDALNHFFLPTESFDAFYFEKEKIDLRYQKVNTPKESGKGAFQLNQKDAPSITIKNFKNKGLIEAETAQQIILLLNNDAYTIKGRPIRPSDIGILVRNNSEAQSIKKVLNKMGIPSVSVTDKKILETREAKELTPLLEALIYRKRSKINESLLSVFTQWNNSEIKKIKEDVVIETFRDFHERWEKDGIYAGLSDYINRFKIRQRLLQEETNQGERIITNLYHLMEILHQTENRQHFSPEELLDWYKIQLDQKGTNGDEMLQRIESDEEAVKIMTIHKSKGLEYNIVFAPFLDFKIRRKDRVELKDEEGRYISEAYAKIKKEEHLLHLYETQQEQENRRLVYVALTRAVYKCYIYENTSSYSKNSTLKAFLRPLIANNKSTELIELSSPPIENRSLRYRKEQLSKRTTRTATSFHLDQPNWQLTSYSGLSEHPNSTQKEKFIKSEDLYDTFIFKELIKGAKTGTFIHDIFEKVNFSNPKTWDYIIKKSLQEFYPNQERIQPELIYNLLGHVLNASLPTMADSFQLSDLSPENTLAEMEFDFSMQEFTPSSLEELRKNEIFLRFGGHQRIVGVMKGFVDLFFYHNGKYYILDWKTNYLGPTINHYNKDAVEQAMTENNYHLQYLIYTYAIDLYLKQRLGEAYNFEEHFGGVYYLFVRGMRQGKNNGVFFTQPKIKELELMQSIFKETPVEQ